MYVFISKTLIIAARIFASTPTDIWTPIPGATSVTLLANSSMITAAREAKSHYGDTTNSQAATAANTAIMLPSANTSISAPTISPPDGSIVKLNKSHKSAGAPITAREFGKLLHVVTQSSVMIINIFCWY